MSSDGWARYRRLQKLGQGGFGAAFLVESRADASRKFVVKEVALRDGDKKAAEEARKEAACHLPFNTIQPPKQMVDKWMDQI